VAKANVTSNNWLKLLFNATAIANIADNAATSPITTIQVALHTADPGATGNQSTSEATYTGYARVAVNRNSAGSGWTASSAQSTSPQAAITFGAGTAGSGTVTHFSVGKTSSGATDMFYSGTVTPNIVTGNGITPQLTTATAITES
jgi:hypothetical protein